MIPAAPDPFLAAAGFVLGAIAGSFVATLVLRWPEGRSVVRGRSACDACGKALGAAELVPLLSWLALKGRCRGCRARIDERHVAVELAAAALGTAALLAAPGPAGLVSALFGWWLLALALLDLEHHWLPDRLTLPLIPAGLAVAMLPMGLPLIDRAIGAAAGLLALGLVRSAYRALRGREGMGGGDPKLLAALGAWLGWQQLPFVLAGAGLLGLAFVALRRLRGGAFGMTDRLPLGTLMILAAWPLWLVTTAR